MIELTFSEKEIKIILESLLFSSSVDVCANWYKDDIDNMIELSKKIRLQNPKIPTESIYVYSVNEYGFDETQTKDIVSYFPELEINKEEIL
jgi:hypothetical protein